MIKNNHKLFSRDLELGINLLKKSLEIINYVLHINKELKFSLENPKGLMRKLDIMKPYNVLLTSYCKYGFKYRKDTNFWYNFNLKLKPPCRKNDYCKCIIKSGKGRPIHPTEIAYKPRHEGTITETMELKEYKKNGIYQDYTTSYYLYRIPPELCDSIVSQVLFS